MSPNGTEYGVLNPRKRYFKQRTTDTTQLIPSKRCKAIHLNSDNHSHKINEQNKDGCNSDLNPYRWKPPKLHITNKYNSKPCSFQGSVQKVVDYQNHYAILQAKLQALLDVKLGLLGQEDETISNIERLQNLAKAHDINIPNMDTELFQELRTQHEWDLNASIQHSLTRYNHLDRLKLNLIFPEGI